MYVARATANDPFCGAIKLNKILYHADFRAFLELGRPITRVPYVALEMGPAPYRLVPVREALIEAGDARLVRELKGTQYQHRLVALRDPDESVFASGELALVDSVIAELRNKGWKALSDATHQAPGYRAADPGAVIPYESAFVSSNLTDEDKARAITVARGRGL